MFQMSIPDISAVASGNILTSRFVKGDVSNDFQVVQCGAGDAPLGVGQEPTHSAPIPGADAFAATAGDPIDVFLQNARCLLTVGAAVTRFSLLKSDSTGRGIMTTSVGDAAGAIALQSATAADQKVWVIVLRGTQAPTFPTLSFTTSQTFTASQSGGLIIAHAVSLTFTLPAGITTPGLRFTFSVDATAVASGSGLLVKQVTGEQIYGDGLTTTTSKGILNTQATAKDGDSVTVESDGVRGWAIIAIIGTWAREA